MLILEDPVLLWFVIRCLKLMNYILLEGIKRMYKIVPKLVGFSVKYPSFSFLVNFSCFCNAETKDWRRPTAALMLPLFSKDFNTRCSEWLTQATRSLFFVWNTALPTGQCCLTLLSFKITRYKNELQIMKWKSLKWSHT